MEPPDNSITIRVVSPTVVEGYRVITGWAKLRKIYFHLEFSQPILSSQLHDGNRRNENTPVINGTELCGLFCFDKKWNNELICKVALSSVSIENARLNMATEVPDGTLNILLVLPKLVGRKN